MTALKKHCPKAHFEPVYNDNGADAYCMKEDTRIEGPWEFGTKPLRQNVKGESTQARAEKNARILNTPIHELVDNGEIAISQVPMI